MTRAVSTGVLTNNVFFFLSVSLKFSAFVENTLELWFHKKKTKHPKIVVLKFGPRL